MSNPVDDCRAREPNGPLGCDGAISELGIKSAGIIQTKTIQQSADCRSLHVSLPRAFPDVYEVALRDPELRGQGGALGLVSGPEAGLDGLVHAGAQANGFGGRTLAQAGLVPKVGEDEAALSYRDEIGDTDLECIGDCRKEASRRRSAASLPRADRGCSHA